MRVFICSEGISNPVIVEDIMRAGHQHAISTSNIDAVIVQPLSFLEDDGELYVWQISSYQKSVLENISKNLNIPFFVYDNEDDMGYVQVNQTFGYLGHDSVQEISFIRSEMDADSLDYLLGGSGNSEYEKVTKGVSNYSSHLSPAENAFIDSVMGKDVKTPTPRTRHSESLRNAPVDEDTSFNQQHKSKSTFISNDDVL